MIQVKALTAVNLCLERLLQQTSSLEEDPTQDFYTSCLLFLQAKCEDYACVPSLIPMLKASPVAHSKCGKTSCCHSEAIVALSHLSFLPRFWDSLWQALEDHFWENEESEPGEFLIDLLR